MTSIQVNLIGYNQSFTKGSFTETNFKRNFISRDLLINDLCDFMLNSFYLWTRRSSFIGLYLGKVINCSMLLACQQAYFRGLIQCISPLKISQSAREKNVTKLDIQFIGLYQNMIQNICWVFFFVEVCQATTFTNLDFSKTN